MSDYQSIHSGSTIDDAVSAVSAKADKTATVSTVTYDTTNKKLTKTINEVTTDIVTVATLKSDMSITKSDVGLSNVDNTTDLNKPISTATQTALNAKSTVSVAATGTATDTVQYITVDGTEKKLAGGSKVYYQTTEPTDAKEGDLWGNEEGGSGGGTVWGAITGTLSNQTDLQTTLDAKANVAHTHTIANVTDLQTTLDGKVPTTRTVATIDLADDITVDELFGALKSKFVDMLYPIGARYVQLAGMPEPSTFGGTWEADTTYNGRSLWCDSTKTIGTAIAAGLPNIKGSFTKGGNQLGVNWEIWATSDAMSASGSISFPYGGSGTKSTTNASTLNFDASAGQYDSTGTKQTGDDIVYGKSDTVQPPAISVIVWKRTA